MTAYYNEIDPYAAQWLRNLIQAGHIAPGYVDERSIVDVDPRELNRFLQCHFFAGIGGWSIALRIAGWPDDRRVWTGSCPCQPLSVAGQRKGHADERHLWPAFYSLIAQRRPAIIFGEQVAGNDGLEWFAGVRADLEECGYACGGADLPAASVGAPHQRQRLFWSANLYGAKSAGECRSWQPDQTIIERTLAEGFQIRSRRFSELVAMDVAQRSPSYVEAKRVVDGIPGRVDEMHAFGNAIVPQIAAKFIAASVEAIGD
jgi:DNA (cytosine-5)-methyltransferase 1